MLDNTQNPAGPHHWVDSSDVPLWGKADDGRNVRLIADVDLQADHAIWLAEACKHTQQFTGKTVNAGGVQVFKRYCKTCGIATTQAIPYRSVEGTTVTLIDTVKRDALVDRYITDRRNALEDIANRAANRTQPDRRNEYAEYLNSPEWRERRALVLDRCAGLCEGCRTQPADEVHHLTYRNVRREFLFELVGLCAGCHTRWHEQAA